ncbi:MAG: S41 family peptidase, partial [candidate division WOR-3 bacterium]
VEAALEGLMRQGVDRVILDLRRVAWGRLQEAVRVAQLFIGSGVLARTIGRDGRVIETYSAEPGRQRFGGRLAVVIDRSTMGAAEVIAAAVVEHRRGEVVGERTFGGGGEQQLFRLRDGGGLWLTTVKYAGPSGVAIMGSQGRGAGGVAPTVEVARAELGLRPEELEQEREVGERAREREGEGARERAGEGGKEDVVLRRAIELLQAPVSPGRR